MHKHTLFTVASFLFCPQVSGDTPDGIYHKGWIDFNKNGKMDLYENPKACLLYTSRTTFFLSVDTK